VNFLKVFFSLIGLTLISKVLGFLREVFLSFYYGASYITDAYLVALTIPGVLFAFFTTAISVSFIPIFSKISENIEERNNFVNNLFSSLIIVSSVIVLLTLIFAEILVLICAPGFDQVTTDLAIKFTRLFVVGVYFSCWLSVFCAFLSFFKKFTIIALAGIPFNLSILASIALSYYYGENWLILGAVFGKLFEIIFLYPHVKKLNYKFKFKIDFNDENIKKLIFLSIPLMFSVAVNQINIIVDKSIASTLQVGAISAVNYSHYLIELVIGIFVLTVVTIFFPDLAKFFQKKDFNNIQKTTEKSLQIVNFFVIPSFIFFVFQSSNIISFVYERGNFRQEDVELTSSAFMFFSIGLLGLAYREVLSRIYYAMHNTKIPVINSIIGVIINIILALILSKYMGVSGLALATSLSAFITAILLVFYLKKFNIFLNYKNILSCFFKKIISATLAIFSIILFSQDIFLPLFFFIFLFFYFLFLLLLKDEILVFTFNKIRGKLTK
jgi:putative peptidoglycan lipid II flippase